MVDADVYSIANTHGGLRIVSSAPRLEGSTDGTLSELGCPTASANTISYEDSVPKGVSSTDTDVVRECRQDDECVEAKGVKKSQSVLVLLPSLFVRRSTPHI